MMEAWKILLFRDNGFVSAEPTASTQAWAGIETAPPKYLQSYEIIDYYR